jgi:hypothetical protein
MAAAADERVRDKMALDRWNYFIREKAKKQGLDFHTVRGFMDNVAPWADHNRPMDDEEWDQLESDSDEDVGAPPPPRGGPQVFSMATPRGFSETPSKAKAPPDSGVFNQSPPKPEAPSVFSSGGPPPPPSQGGATSSKGPYPKGKAPFSVFTNPGSNPPPPPPPPSTSRKEQARGIDELFNLHMRHQAAQAERHNANTQKWLEHLLGEVQRMGRRHDEQNRAMEALSSKQNTMQDLVADRMNSTRQAAQPAEEQRAQMTDQRFQQLIEQVGRLASSQQQQSHHTEMLSLLKQYLAEHAHAVQNQSAQMQRQI